jgi:hypothetical protein
MLAILAAVQLLACLASRPYNPSYDYFYKDYTSDDR